MFRHIATPARERNASVTNFLQQGTAICDQFPFRETIVLKFLKFIRISAVTNGSGPLYFERQLASAYGSFRVPHPTSGDRAVQGLEAVAYSFEEFGRLKGLTSGDAGLPHGIGHQVRVCCVGNGSI